MWSKEKALFDHEGDCSWDPDWYNGFSLSGMARAVECGTEAIAAPARTLVRECSAGAGADGKLLRAVSRLVAVEFVDGRSRYVLAAGLCPERSGGDSG